MLKINIPEHLFEGRGVYRHIRNVDKNATPATNADNVILLYEYITPEIPANLKQMMEKMMLACHFDPQATIYINIHNNPWAIGELQSHYAPKLILAFGNFSLSRNMVKFSKNKAYTLGGTLLIQTDDLAKLDKDPAGKKHLWTTLQQALNLA